VIVISFAMDVYFSVSTVVNNASTILVIFLLWRVLRIFNGELIVVLNHSLSFWNDFNLIICEILLHDPLFDCKNS